MFLKSSSLVCPFPSDLPLSSVKFYLVRTFLHQHSPPVHLCASRTIKGSWSLNTTSYLAQLNITLDHDYATHNDPDSDNESSHSDDNYQDFELDLPPCYSHRDSSGLQAWVEGIKHDPLRRARRVIRLLCSSDEHRRGFLELIQNGNKHGWFDTKDKDGECIAGNVPELQLLRDVKTRWDSVYMMLMRLRVLRLVSLSRLQ